MKQMVAVSIRCVRGYMGARTGWRASASADLAAGLSAGVAGSLVALCVGVLVLVLTMTSLKVLLAVATLQIVSACKNCVVSSVRKSRMVQICAGRTKCEGNLRPATLIKAAYLQNQAHIESRANILGKEEKAMFRAHSDACIAQSGVDPKLVDGLLAGQLEDRPELRRHVYCVLVKCKLVGKDGKLLKSAVFGKLATRMDGRNASKVLENCATQVSDATTPEDVAWNLFRCGYDRKAVLFDYMPPTQQETL